MTKNHVSDNSLKLRIKKFRIRPRIHYVKRYLKPHLGEEANSQEMEIRLQEQNDRFIKTLTPFAFYQTWSHGEIPASISSLIQDEEAKKAVSISLLVATVGLGPEEQL